MMQSCIPEEVERAHFSLATPNTDVVYCIVCIIVWFINKTHLKLLQEERKVALQQIFGCNKFEHKI